MDGNFSRADVGPDVGNFSGQAASQKLVEIKRPLIR